MTLRSKFVTLIFRTLGAKNEKSLYFKNRNSNSVTVYLLISILNMETMYGPTHHMIDQGTVF